MSELLLTFSQFHFLRPLWLLAIPAALVLVIIFWRQKSSALNWGKAINRDLLNHLLEDSANAITSSSRWPWLALLLAWCIAAVALAGPTWQKLPQPVHQKQDALAIVLDLSLSMYSEDIKPSRLVRARHKIIDILTARNEGLSALIAYSRDAHVASPLTDDHNTVANLVPALTPEMMPALGSNPRAGIKTAIELLANTGLREGRILLISDGITARDAEAISDLLDDTKYQLSIMAVATPDGAPIPLSKGFVKDNNGTIVTPQLDRSSFQQLASAVNGRYIETRLDDSDIDFLLPQSPKDLTAATRQTERQFDQWQDQGGYLCLLLLPLALLGFRRGWLLALPFLLLAEPQQSYALEWQDLWQTRDQQAMTMLQQGDAEAAAKTFKNGDWQAAAQYKADKFEQAAKQYQSQLEQQASHEQQASPEQHYNLANALAKSGKLDEAIEQYKQALALNPNFDDAAHNKAIVEQAKQQQQNQQNQDQNQENQDQQQDQENQDQQGDNQQKSDDQQSEQQQEQNNDKQNDSQSDKQNNSEQKPDDQENSSDPEKDAQNQPEQPEQDQTKEPGEQEQSEEEQQDKQQPSAAEQNKAEQEQQEQERQQQALKQAAAEEADKQEQATEQWLRQIPDDPSGLLRRKFDYEYRLKQAEQQSDQEDQPLW